MAVEVALQCVEVAEEDSVVEADSEAAMVVVEVTAEEDSCHEDEGVSAAEEGIEAAAVPASRHTRALAMHASRTSLTGMPAL